MKKKLLIVVAILGGILVIGIPVGLYMKNYYTVGFTDHGAATTAIPKPSGKVIPPAAGADDWPSWRGKAQDNSSVAAGMRTDWRGGLHKAWEISYLCQGDNSSTWGVPSIQGRHLVVMGRDQSDDLVFCLDSKSGELLWASRYAASNKDNYGMGPRATACIDGDLVITLGRGGELMAWKTADGSLVWKRSLREDGGVEPEWGHSASPMVSGELLFIQGGKEILAVAFHKRTGEIAWKRSGALGSYSTALAARFDGIDSVLMLHAETLAAYAPETGKLLWEVPFKTPNSLNITTPVVSGPWVVVGAAYSVGAAGVKVENGKASVAWRNREYQPHHTDPHILGGHLYGYSGFSKQNGGDFRCVELATGKLAWKTNALGCGTAIRAGVHLICLDHKGKLFLVKPDPSGLKLVSSFPNAITGVQELSWTKPVLADGLLYLRYRQRLIAYAVRD